MINNYEPCSFEWHLVQALNQQQFGNAEQTALLRVITKHKREYEKELEKELNKAAE